MRNGYNMQIYSWHNLKNNNYIPTSKIHQYYTYLLIFMLRTGNKQDVLVFSNNSNRKHKTIKFKYNISHSHISFLDILIYKNKINILQKTLYENPLISNPIFMHIQTIPRHLQKPYRIALCWGSKSSVPHQSNIKITVQHWNKSS